MLDSTLKLMSLFNNSYVLNYNPNSIRKEYSIYIQHKIRRGNEIRKSQVTMVMMVSLAGILL